MPEAWKQWVGQTVDGKFPLQRYLGGSEGSAVFLTERREGDRVQRAAIKLIRSEPENDDRQLARWRLAAAVSHPNLIALFEMGRCQLGDAAMLYVVMECAEENLGDVLPTRALTPEEARAMLGPTLEVLAYLHGKGFVHGHIKPSNIMADGDQLKISSETLLRAGQLNEPPDRADAYTPPESTRGIIPVAETISPAGDVWSLGMTFVEALTQSLPVMLPAAQADLQLPRTLPEPFLEIARHCLVFYPQGRWTVEEISARLEGRALPAKTQARPAAAAASASPAKHPAGRPAGAAAARPSSRARAKRTGYAVPVMVALGVAAIVIWPRFFRHDAAAPQSPAVEIEQPPAQPAVEQAPPAASQEPLHTPSAAANEQDEKAAATPVAASVRAGIRNADESKLNPGSNAGAKADPGGKLPADSVVRGEVAQQVLPDVSQSAMNTIQGGVRVSVRVDVDPSGSVEGAQLDSPGPSKYFSSRALEAAQRWKFQPPKVAGRNVLSTWTLRFEFKRDGTTVVPKQDEP